MARGRTFQIGDWVRRPNLAVQGHWVLGNIVEPDSEGDPTVLLVRMYYLHEDGDGDRVFTRFSERSSYRHYDPTPEELARCLMLELTQ
jgi:hypothetical protein